MRGAPCVVSVAEHAGWAHLICVAASGLVPVVIARRRVTLIDPGLPKMPYEHESVGMKEAEANALIARVRRSIAARTTLALQQRMVTELSDLCCRGARHQEAPISRASRDGACGSEIVSSAMRRRRDAVSAGHLPRGQAAWPRGAVVPPWR